MKKRSVAPRLSIPAGRRSAWITSGVVLWVMAPLAFAASAVVIVSRAEAFPASSVWIQPEVGASDIDRAVGLQLQWDKQTDLYAPAWSGVVQNVYLEEGGEINSGSPLVRVDGIDRIAYASPAPFFRTLTRGDTGQDVSALNSLLEDRGLESAASDEYTWATSRGVADLAAQIGAHEMDSPSFDPAWVIYLPQSALTISALSLSVGAPAPSGGTVIASSKRSLAAAGLVDAGNIPSAVETDKDSAVPVLPRLAADDGEELIVGTTRLGLNSTLDGIAEESLPSLAGIVEYVTPFTRGILRQPIPSGYYRVPASAVITDREGGLCVLKATQRDGGGKVTDDRPVMIDVVFSNDGVVWAAGDITTRDLINVSPSAQDRSCGSPASTG